MKTTPHNLPSALRSFVGRERELLEIQQSVLDPRISIVTLVGPAGVGKTVLALEDAHRLLEQGKFPGGIVWLDCRQMAALDAMIETMRETFALPVSPAVRQHVHAHLRSHSCLLIFDGYDTVAQDMEVLAFLNQLPRSTKALVTSRERVGLLGQEWVFVIEAQPRAESPSGLELTITRQIDGRYAVAVNGDFSHTFDIAAVKLTPQRYQKELLRATPHYGQRLFKDLFPEGSVACQALAQLPQAPNPAGTLLIVTEDPEAQSVPWEYLHDSNDYLALTHHLVRGIPPEQRKGYGGEILAEALYLVAVPSDPLLFNGRPVTELNVTKELEHLKTALQDAEASYRAVIITPPTLDTLHEALAPRGRHTLIHFMGHGLATEQGAMLLFEDETGAGRAVTAQEFARRVQGYAFLVLLNACESARTLMTPISNLAYSLVLNGLPYTLGMQFTVPDAAALKLSRVFYRFLAQGHMVEEALRQARIALSALDEPAGLRDYAFGIPVLYTSLVQGFARFRVEPGEVRIQETRPPIEFDTAITEAATFRGRKEELVEIGKRLKDDRKMLTLVGPGGIGKSALARRAAKRFAWRFPAGVLGLSLEHLPPKEEFVARLGCWLLGKRSDELHPEELEREVIDAFKGHERLLVLDNYETLLGSLSASSSETKKKAQALGQFIRRL
ncbi:MAG: CHAT domain-containing protein, partial [Deltaproteobacteria bacterium]|nr:CHAT domain-containing protein [Deltaproteobacteria bacterium]